MNSQFSSEDQKIKKIFLRQFISDLRRQDLMIDPIKNVVQIQKDLKSYFFRMTSNYFLRFTLRTFIVRRRVTTRHTIQKRKDETHDLRLNRISYTRL